MQVVHGTNARIEAGDCRIVGFDVGEERADLGPSAICTDHEVKGFCPGARSGFEENIVLAVTVANCGYRAYLMPPLYHSLR